jgi:copper resistance protein D
MKKIIITFVMLVIFFFPNVEIFAHSYLKSSSPAEGEVVKQPLNTIQIMFETEIEQLGELSLSKDNQVIAVKRVTIEGDTLTGQLNPPLESGAYEANWRIVGEDGHPIEGKVTFSVDLPVQEQVQLEKPVVQEEQPKQDDADIGTKFLPYYLVISESLLYLCFSILVGGLMLKFIPEEKKPTISLPRSVYFMVILGILFFSMGPVIQVFSYFVEAVGVSQTLSAVLYDFEVGKAWLFTCWIGLLLYFSVLLNGSKYLQAFFTLLLVLAVGYASHAASLSFWRGFTSHTLHFLAIISWTGVLFIVAWFSKDTRNWGRFLRWFTPFAVICVVLIVWSGFLTMKMVVEPKDYVSSWLLPYGQALLVKHLVLVPLFVLAGVNGILMRKRIGQSDFKPLRWLKAESLFVLFVFMVTGVLGTQSPPHDIETTVQAEGYSTLFKWFHPNKTKGFIELHVWEGAFLLGGAFSVLMLILMLLSFNRKKSVMGSIMFGILFIVSAYLTLILAAH